MVRVRRLVLFVLVLLTLTSVFGVRGLAQQHSCDEIGCQAVCSNAGCGDCLQIEYFPCNEYNIRHVRFHCAGCIIGGYCTCSGGGGCFLAGTPILMADGTTKPIEDIRSGDLVAAYDKLENRFRHAGVDLVYAPTIAKSYLLINDTIRVTGTQPVLLDGRWTETRALRVGDSIITGDGSAMLIWSIQTIEEEELVYNFRVDGLHTYVAAGIVVHNKEGYYYEQDPCAHKLVPCG